MTSAGCGAASAALCRATSSRDAAQRDVEHGVEGAPGERRALPRALDLDQRARVGRDDVRVDLGAGVLLVGQVQPHPAVDDPDADGRDLAGQRLGVGEPAAGAEPGDGVGERDVGPGDRGGAGAAVGLQDVAVERDGVLAQRREVDAGAQRPADQPADLVGAAADAALDRLAVAAGVRGRGQHRVLGGHPAQAGSLAPPRHALRDAGRAQHLRVAELDEHRPGRVLLETAGEAHGAQLVVGSSVSSFHHPHFRVRSRHWRPTSAAGQRGAGEPGGGGRVGNPGPVTPTTPDSRFNRACSPSAEFLPTLWSCTRSWCCCRWPRSGHCWSWRGRCGASSSASGCCCSRWRGSRRCPSRRRPASSSSAPWAAVARSWRSTSTGPTPCSSRR